MSYTPLGFKIRAVGLNPRTARLNGISGRRIAVQTFVIGGAAAGLGGGIAVLGQGALVSNFSPQYGFLGIAVALLARLNPIWIIPAAFTFSVLRVGSNGLFVAEGLDPAVGDLLVATFIIALLLFGLVRLPTAKAGL
jgi:simple sugar transport system permease protein